MIFDHRIATEAMRASSRPRLLLLAYACSPARGSEYAVGWNRAVEAARMCDTWVLTLDDPDCNTEIEKYLLDHGPIDGLHIVQVPQTALQRSLSRIPGFPYHIGYQSWHRAAFKAAQQMHKEQPFDLVHHVSYCGYREPGYLWKLDAPFIWGPVGGTQNYPWRFLGQAGVSGAATEGLRTVLNHFQLRYSPRVRQAIRRAAVILSANSTIQNDVQRAHGVSTLRQVETGLRSVREVPRQDRSSSGPLRLLWSGQLYPLKGMPLLLHAMAQLPEDVRCQLRVLGEGPYRATYEKLAQRLGVAEDVEWMGWRPHAEALKQLDWADVFAFTSLRDTTGTVVLEAMSAGLPIICLDHQGMHDVVTEECGIKIPVGSPQQVITDLTKAVTQLATQPQKRGEHSRGSLQRAHTYLWSNQGERMAQVYRDVLGLSDCRSMATHQADHSETPKWLSPVEGTIERQEVIAS